MARLGTLALFASCSSHTGSSANAELKAITMVQVKSSGSLAYLGSKDSLAPLDEKPLTAVHFHYDFEIGVHEVTVGEYHEVLQTYPTELSSLTASQPITWVSLLDAVRL